MLYLYLSIYLCNHENNVTMCPPDYHHNGFVGAHALGHMMYGCTVHVVINRRGGAHCFHDCIYITAVLLFSNLSTLCVMDLDRLQSFIYIIQLKAKYFSFFSIQKLFFTLRKLYFLKIFS